jgi:hypothetical protein
MLSVVLPPAVDEALGVGGIYSSVQEVVLERASELVIDVD